VEFDFLFFFHERMSFLNNIICSGGSSSVMNMSAKHGSTVHVNGKTHRIPDGRSISIVNGTIYVDGKVWNTDDAQNKALSSDMAIANKIEIHIHPDAKGNVPDISSETNQIVVHGNAKKVRSGTGKIHIQGNSGQAESSTGNVQIDGYVTGDVTTSTGNINIAGDIHGSAESSTGNIRAKQINHK
jgi:hypothetical protein